MSRGNVFKLSGNMALGANSNDTYSTSELQNIKSSLRLLKARQSQKKSHKEIDFQNYGGSYSANIPQRSQMKKNSQPIPPRQDYNYYESNAKNHMPTNITNTYKKYPESENPYPNNYQSMGSKQSTDIYEKQQRQFPVRQRGHNSTAMGYNEPNYTGSRNYEQTTIDNRKQYGMKQHPIKEISRTENLKKNTYSYNDNEGFQNYNPRQKAQTRPPLRKQQENRPCKNEGISSPNQIENKPIKEINRENKPQIIEYDPSSFVECSVGCGRKFNPDSIAKHEKNCLKVFQKKRKQFNTQDQRIIDGQHKQIVKQVVREEKFSKPQGKMNKKDDKASKWKAQSMALRAMIKQNRNQSLSAEEQKQVEEAKDVGMVKCPYCGRSFNQKSGEKHIKFCETQSKKNKFKR